MATVDHLLCKLVKNLTSDGHGHAGAGVENPPFHFFYQRLDQAVLAQSSVCLKADTAGGGFLVETVLDDIIYSDSKAAVFSSVVPRIFWSGDEGGEGIKI